MSVCLLFIYRITNSSQYATSSKVFFAKFIFGISSIQFNSDANDLPIYLQSFNVDPYKLKCVSSKKKICRTFGVFVCIDLYTSDTMFSCTSGNFNLF